MADGYFTAAMAGIRAALVADAAVFALVADRVVDEPRPDIAFPYIRFGRIIPISDDTDGALGARITMGIDCFSRPVAGQIEAARMCEAVAAALHRQESAVSVAGFNLVEIEVQTWAVDRGADGASYTGKVSIEVRLDA